MTIHRLLAASALSLLLAPVFVLAADSEGNFTVISFGTKSCGQVVEDFDKADWAKLSNSVWVGGYLTAINKEAFAGANVAKGTDPAARDLWIYNYCTANPLSDLYGATDALVADLTGRAE